MLNAAKWLKSCLLIFLTLSSLAVQAQSAAVVIKGRVGDSVTHALLPDASLTLLHLPDSIVIRRAVSGKNGFLFNRLKPGRYLLYLSNIGYKDTLVPISLKVTDSVVDLGFVWLVPTPRSLVEVVVKAIIPPVITKSDTLVYDVGAYKTRPNATVEELLKKLPGIDVDRDGNVTIQGEKVQKVFIDGKEFFLNDPKLATQNLLADMVDKVEAFNEKSERAKLTGIPDQNPAKVINLRLKPDKKKGLFGGAESTAASEGMYGLKANANYFKGDMYLSGVGNTSSGGNLQNGGGTLHNKVNDLSLNYRNTISEKWQVTANYTGSANNISNRVQSQQQTFFTDSTLLQNKETTTGSKQNNHGVNALIQYNIDSFNSINARTTFNLFELGNSNKDITAGEIKKTDSLRAINDANTDNNTTSNGWNGSFNLDYNHRFKKQGRYLGLNLSGGNSRSNGQSSLASLTHVYNDAGLLADSLLRDQLFLQNARGQNFSVSITYTEPLAKDQVLDFSWRLNKSANGSAQNAFNYNTVTGKYDTPDSTTSNSYKSSNSSQQVAVGYNYFRKKLQWQAGMAIARNSQLNKDLSGHQPDLNQSVTNIYPRASLIYSISKQKNLQLSYNGRNRPPSVRELQPLPDYSNPLLVRLGNPALKQEFSNDIMLNYKDFSARNSRSLLWQLQFTNTAHKIVDATHINSQGIQEQQSVNLDGNYTVNTTVDYRIGFGKGSRKGSAGFNTRLRYDNMVNLVNAERNLRKTFTWNQNVRLEYYVGDKFVVNAIAAFNRSRSRYSIDAGNTTTLFSQYYNTYVLYELPGAISVSSGMNINITAAQQHIPGTQAVVWNAAVMKRLFKNQAGELKLSVFDLLNKNNNVSQYSGDNSIATTEQEVLKRVVALSFRYNFRINKWRGHD
jgi:hypothetical protein